MDNSVWHNTGHTEEHGRWNAARAPGFVYGI
jgi:hypothetical protein